MPVEIVGNNIINTVFKRNVEAWVSDGLIRRSKNAEWKVIIAERAETFIPRIIVKGLENFELDLPFPYVGKGVSDYFANLVIIDYQDDAPICSDCGAIMVRNGSCYRCMNCESTSGCS